MAVLNGVPAILGFGSSVVTTISDMSHPKDKERRATADALYAAALNGSTGAEIQLRCLSGDQSVRSEAVRLGLLSPDEISRGTPCGFATESARAYAQSLVGKLSAQRMTDTATRSVVAASVGYQAGQIPTWVYVAVGAGLFLYLRRKR